MSSISSKQREFMKNKAREQGFDLSSVPHCKLKEYNALSDANMRHYFENKKIQQLLYRTGQIDRHGRIIDPQKNKSKVNILEREFKEAERVEQLRLKEEIEMRYRVQRKRFNDLEATRRESILMKVKQDRDLSKEIISTIKAATAYSPPQSKSRGGTGQSKFSNSGRNAMGDSGSFYITNVDDDYGMDQDEY
jgi:hypothetical protein